MPNKRLEADAPITSASAPISTTGAAPSSATDS